MNTIDDPAHDEDEFSFNFGEASVLVSRALWVLVNSPGVTPHPKWPELKDDLLGLSNALRAAGDAPIVCPIHSPGRRTKLKPRRPVSGRGKGPVIVQQQLILHRLSRAQIFGQNNT